MNERFYILHAGFGNKPWDKSLAGFDTEAEAMALLHANNSSKRLLVCRGPYTPERFAELNEANGWRVVGGRVESFDRYSKPKGCRICGKPFTACVCDDEDDVCIAGNPALGGKCGEPDCACATGEGCEVCGCSPCSCDGVPCEGCGAIECECESPAEDEGQGDLFGDQGGTAAPERVAVEPDAITARLIAGGYVHNEFLLDLNGCLRFDSALCSKGDIWALPSRLFQFPIRVAKGPDGVRRLALSHPQLVDHPLAVELRSKGFDVLEDAADCPNEHGVSVDFGGYGLWHHAVDLIASHHRALLDTRRFTSDEAIFQAVSYRCSYPHEKGPLLPIARQMREVMAALDSAEPARLAASGCFSTPSPNTSEGKKKPTWPVNTSLGYHSTAADREALAWAYIHGIEAGWFVNASGFLNWSERGRRECAKVEAAAEAEGFGVVADLDEVCEDFGLNPDDFKLEPAGSSSPAQLSLF